MGDRPPRAVPRLVPTVLTRPGVGIRSTVGAMHDDPTATIAKFLMVSGLIGAVILAIALTDHLLSLIFRGNHRIEREIAGEGAE